MNAPTDDELRRILLSQPDVGPAERAALLRAFDDGWIAPVGPEIDAFEAELGEWSGWSAVALSSGSAALHLALLAVGVEPGDDVLVSSFTFAASANAVTYAGARPRFVDSETTSWNMSPDLLAEELRAMGDAGRLPAAVIPVDLYGQCADYDRIMPICAEYGVPVIQDAAEALGASHGTQPAGTSGDIGVYSFNGNKIITTSGGGALISPDPDIAQRVRYLSTQARQPAVHYEHTDIGFNYRMSNLLAALGRAQLGRLIELVARRRAINDRYRAALGGVDGMDFMPVAPWSTGAGGHVGWNGWLTCVVFDDAARRDRVQHTLDQANIESRPLWKPMHMQPVFADVPARVDGTSERLFATGLCLPSGSVLNDADIDRVIEVMLGGL
ncbi:MAG: aminotransferase class I/II-fold pyridoxal phosphate-dependent enzyme [Actinomycetota bacterium]